MNQRELNRITGLVTASIAEERRLSDGLTSEATIKVREKFLAEVQSPDGLTNFLSETREWVNRNRYLLRSRGRTIEARVSRAEVAEWSRLLYMCEKVGPENS
jgi:hypothetical protein